MKNLILLLLLTVSLMAYSQDNKGLARVKKIMGVEVYVYAEPVRDYEVVGEAKSGTAGTVISEVIGSQVGMTERINNIVNKALKKRSDKKNPVDFDAVIIDNDSKGILIKFKPDPS